MFDPEAVPSPCFVLDERLFRRNLRTMAALRKRSEARLLLALKGFALWHVFPWLRDVVDGAAVSSLNEALLASRELGGHCHAYAPAFLESEWPRISSRCQRVTFNSLGQYERFRGGCKKLSPGLRINPEYATVKTDLYNPCAPGSRLGITAEHLSDGLPEGIEGLHCHNLCESDSLALEATLETVERRFGHLLDDLLWFNLGGGHLLTDPGYDGDHLIEVLQGFRRRHPGVEVVLEPGAAFAWRTGVLVATVQDIVVNHGVRTAILDTSFATHMPDCLEMPYKPVVRGTSEAETGRYVYRLGGCSCLAGDVVGDYGFDREPRLGQRLVFEDMMHYTMVKTTMFNGINLPAIGIWRSDDSFELVKTFGFDDYRSRLS